MKLTDWRGKIDGVSRYFPTQDFKAVERWFREIGSDGIRPVPAIRNSSNEPVTYAIRLGANDWYQVEVADYWRSGLVAFVDLSACYPTIEGIMRAKLRRYNMVDAVTDPYKALLPDGHPLCKDGIRDYPGMR